MQEVCSSMDVQLGGAIKSEVPLITQLVPLTQQHPNLIGSSTPPSSASLKMQSLNCDKRENPTPSSTYWMSNPDNGSGPAANESGFINSQPSMAEFLTHIGPESPKLGTPVFPMVSPSDSGGGMDVPEYPWMKEKKTARKNSASQGTT